MTGDTWRTGLTDEQMYHLLKRILDIEGRLEVPYSRQLSSGDATYLREGDRVVLLLEELADTFPGVSAALRRIPVNSASYTIERVTPAYKPGEATLLGAYVSLQGVKLWRLEPVMPSISRGIPIETFAADGELEIELRSRGRDHLKK